MAFSMIEEKSNKLKDLNHGPFSLVLQIVTKVKLKLGGSFLKKLKLGPEIKPEGRRISDTNQSLFILNDLLI